MPRSNHTQGRKAKTAGAKVGAVSAPFSVEDNSNARAWDEGCKGDRVRNEFIVPELLALIRQHHITSAIDLGAATGYIPRAVQKNLDHRVSWNLLDTDEARLAYAKSLAPNDGSFECRNVDFLAPSQTELTAELTVLSNSVLEFELTPEFCDRIVSYTKPHGWLAVFMPDTLTDIANDCKNKDISGLTEYIQGSPKLLKTDKFTESAYPFYAHRPTTLICNFVSRGLVLAIAKKAAIGSGYYFFGFQRIGV